MKEEKLKQIEAENAEILENLDSQLQILVASDKGPNKLTKGWISLNISHISMAYYFTYDHCHYVHIPFYFSIPVVFTNW